MDGFAAREAIITTIVQDMPDAPRRFLISLKSGDPDRTLLGIKGANKLPAVQWKLLNLTKLSAEQRETLATRLEAILYPQ